MANTPSPSSVPLDVWCEALGAALAFRTLAPWAWMDDTAISVYVDEHNSPWFACVLGGGREVFGLVLYRGEAGFRSLQALHNAESEAAMEDAAFQQSAIDVTFGPRSLLDRHDRERLTALGYAPARGTRQPWPSFRSHRPGYQPWHLDETEVQVLTAALRAVARFAESLRKLPNAYVERAPYEYPILPAPSAAAEPWEWRHWLPLAPEPVPAIRVPDDAAVETLRQLPVAAKLTLELDVFFSRATIREGDRPYFPRHVSIVQGDSGIVIAMDLLDPSKNSPLALGNALLQSIHRLGVRPHELLLAREPLARALLPLAEQLRIPRVSLAEHLPMTAELRASLGDFLER